MRTPKIYPIVKKAMTDTWSSKQRLSLAELNILVRDLLALSTILQKEPWISPVFTRNTIYSDTTLATMSKNILINLVRG